MIYRKYLYINIICMAVLSVNICMNYSIKSVSKHQPDKVIGMELVKRRVFVVWFFPLVFESINYKVSKMCIYTKTFYIINWCLLLKFWSFVYVTEFVSHQVLSSISTAAHYVWYVKVQGIAIMYWGEVPWEILICDLMLRLWFSDWINTQESTCIGT
jgi:hypothetical protein